MSQNQITPAPRRLQPLSFEPRLRVSLIESLVGAVFVVALVAGYFLLTKGLESWLFASISGLVAAVVMVVFYTVRFLRRAPARVEFDERGIEIVSRDHEVERVIWPQITSAKHESSYGLRWVFELGEESVHLRDDGFSTREWDQVARVIQQALRDAGIECEITGLATVFDDDGDDESDDDADGNADRSSTEGVAGRTEREDG